MKSNRCFLLQVLADTKTVVYQRQIRIKWEQVLAGVGFAAIAIMQLNFPSSAPYLLSSLLLCAPLYAAPTPTPAADQQNVAGVDVTGLNETEMKRRLTRELAPKLDYKINLNAGTESIVRRRGDVGIVLGLGWMLARAKRGDKYVPLKLSVDKTKAMRALKRLAPKYEVELRDARIVNRKKGMDTIPEIVGQTLNLGGSVPRLKQEVEKDASARTYNLMVRKQKPRRTVKAFKGIDGRLATFSTDYDSSNFGRTRNMEIAARAIDGTLIQPGSTFSLNDLVGERTAKRGYKEAIIFVDGKKEPGLGGGVSQITGTVFNAALLAGLPIVTYTTHSRPVSYITLGRDATVSWDNFDMKWRNDTKAPIYVTYVVKNGTATATLFGKRTTGQKVRLNVVSEQLGARRIKAKLYRTILVNGKVVTKQKVGDSDYDWKKDDAD